MNSVITIISTVVGILGIAIAIWSIFDTRKKYFKEYLKRKK